MTMPSLAPSEPPAPTLRVLRLEHDGRLREFLPIVLVNAILNIVTVTLYRFWAKTRVRRYLWAGMRLAGDRFEYSGQGLELFLGFLVVLAGVIVPMLAVSAVVEYYWAVEDPVRYGAFMTLFYLVVLFLIGVALYRARRYRLSRTVWRGIRPALVGRAWVYGLMYLAIYIVNGITAGWSYPWGRIRLAEQMMRHTRFGDRAFRFQASSGPLYGRFALFWFGSIGALIMAMVIAGAVAAVVQIPLEADFEDNPVAVAKVAAIGLAFLLALGLPIAALYAFYKARELALIADCMGFEGLTFRFDATTGSLIRLVMGNYLIIVLTLTLGYPLVQLRNFRYLSARFHAVGVIDFDAIRQSAAARPSVGEGLADAFDVGAV